MAKSIIIPEHLNAQERKKAQQLVDEGATQQEIDSMFPAPPPTPPAPAPTFTLEQMQMMQQMANDAAAKAVEADRASRPAPVPVAEAKPMTVYVNGKENEKPDLHDNKSVPLEDFLEDDFIAFHANVGHTMDKFHIGGRLVDPPYSKLIKFETYIGPETQGFGLSANLVFMCCYKTRSRKEMDLFMKDDRWGGEFWNHEVRTVDEGVLLAMEIMKLNKVMEGLNFGQVKAMAMERGIVPGGHEYMRAAVAKHDAEATVKQRAIDLLAVTNAKRKEALLDRADA